MTASKTCVRPTRLLTQQNQVRAADPKVAAQPHRPDLR